MKRMFAGLSIVAMLVFASLGASAQDDTTGGIGLARGDWEDVYGEGKAGQGWVEYHTRDRLPIYVGYSEDVVASIEIVVSKAKNGGLTTEQADGLLAALIPADSELDERFVLPTSPAHPKRIVTMLTYESDWLETAVADDTESFVVMLQTDLSEDGGDELVTGFSILLEQAP